MDKGKEYIIYGSAIILFFYFIFFLAGPLGMILFQSLQGTAANGTGGATGWEGAWGNYARVMGDRKILQAFLNSVTVAGIAAAATTVLAFFLAYGMHCTRLFRQLKTAMRLGLAAPMLLPTITYGFAIIYSFGKQGWITKLAGGELFPIYGFYGLMLGYVMYTLPPAFLMLDNAFGYVDKRFLTVSELMGDGIWRRFYHTALRPMVGTLGGSFLLAFVLAFTDFGIPASVGGIYPVIATELYMVMLGTIPNFASGAVIAVMMLAPAAVGVWVLQYLERFNCFYDGSGGGEIGKSWLRDLVFGAGGTVVAGMAVTVLAVMFVAPFMKNYPYDLRFSSEFIQKVLETRSLWQVYENSLWVAFGTAIIGTIMAYSAALLHTRTAMGRWWKAGLDGIAMVTHTVPGMVLGLGYLMFFLTSDWKGSFGILIACNIVHFFTAPYLMGKNALAKLNPAWETTGELMGDHWLKTVGRVILPNSLGTVAEMFGYYFINAMVTISAVIFLVTARTAVVTSKIKELQHFASFNEIFVLSMLIFATNLAVKLICDAGKKKLSSHMEG